MGVGNLRSPPNANSLHFCVYSVNELHNSCIDSNKLSTNELVHS